MGVYTKWLLLFALYCSIAAGFQSVELSSAPRQQLVGANAVTSTQKVHGPQPFLMALSELPEEGENPAPAAKGPLTFARAITQSPLYTIGAQGAVVLGLLAAIDCGWSGDWSRYGYVSPEVEAQARALVAAVGSFHLACAPVAAVSAWQRSQPIAPATLKVLAVGGLALGQVLLQPDDNPIQFPWKEDKRSGLVQASAAGQGSALQALTALSSTPFVTGFKQLVADAVAGSYDRAAVAARIEAEVTANPAVMYSWQKCPFCLRAKELLLEEVGAEVLVVELDGEGADPAVGKALRAELGRRTGRTSVPSIFIGGQYVGGCNDGPGVVPLEAAGELRPMLAAAGALGGAEAAAAGDEGARRRPNPLQAFVFKKLDVLGKFLD